MQQEIANKANSYGSRLKRFMLDWLGI